MSKNVIKILQLQLTKGLARQASLIYRKKLWIWQSLIWRDTSVILAQPGSGLDVMKPCPFFLLKPVVLCILKDQRRHLTVEDKIYEKDGNLCFTNGRIRLILFLAAVILFVFFRTGALPEADKTIHVIPVTGTVEPGMAAFIKRSVDEILAAEPEALIVFQLDSFGGRVDAALDIVETILDIPQGQSVSFVENGRSLPGP